MKAYRSMKYKTRGNASPQGRPRVFFCCAAADFDRLFEPVTEEILSVQTNAAIWYLAPGEGTMEGDAFLADLSQMQLLIVPVTTTFLRQDHPDPARTVAFAYAVEHHIPVLPLMQEPGLESLFNELCGELQILDKYALKSDPTALPYEEKLKRFLEGVLVTDELAERVRAAFDAYIFLSYRKKDRAAAQKIMRLIHENEFCRDVAIWYDEFLSPGENFNRAISDAMEKSTLFAMVVTPHLLEDPNYVLTTEYPAARDMKKAILPFEAERTSSAELARLYDGLRDTASAEDPEAITQRLQALLTEVALRKNDDPAHTFLMGIAYLSGVDVEIDHTRAVSLITEAAELGLPEALEKLVTMYKTGEGVERNYHTAVQWQRKLADQYRKVENNNPSVQDLDNCFWALCNLGDDLRDIGNLAGAESAYQEAYTWAKSWKVPDTLNFIAQTWFSSIFTRLGDICRELGRLEEALGWFRNSLEIDEMQTAEQRTMSDWTDLSIDYNRIGKIFCKLDRLEEALECYRKGAKCCEALTAAVRTSESQLALSISYEGLGSICRDHGQLQEAKEWYQRELEITEMLAAELDTAEMRGALSVCYERLGDICRDLNHPEDALEWIRKCLVIREALVAETDTIEAQRNLSISYERLGTINCVLGRPEEALKWYQKELSLCKMLVSETRTLEAQRDLSICYESLGSVCRDLDRVEESLKWHLKSLKIREALAANTGTLEARRDLSICYRWLGIAHCDLNHPEEALEYYTKSLNICEKLAAETKTIVARQDLSDCYERLGDFYYDLWQAGKALEWYRKEYEISEMLASESRTPKSRHTLSVSCEKLGDTLRMLGDWEEAQRWYREECEIAKSLAKETDTKEAWKNLSISYNKLSDMCKDLRQIEEALECSRKCIEIIEKQTAENETLETRRNLAYRYERLGDLCRNLARTQEALHWYQKSLTLYKALAKETGTVKMRDHLGACYYQLGTLEQLSRRERIAYLQRFREIGEQLFQETLEPRYQNFIDVADSEITELINASMDFQEK